MIQLDSDDEHLEVVFEQYLQNESFLSSRSGVGRQKSQRTVKTSQAVSDIQQTLSEDPLNNFYALYPLECIYCSKTFQHRSSLTRHIKQVHRMTGDIFEGLDTVESFNTIANGSNAKKGRQRKPSSDFEPDDEPASDEDVIEQQSPKERRKIKTPRRVGNKFSNATFEDDSKDRQENLSSSDDDASFRCDLCNKRYNNSTRLSRHKRRCHARQEAEKYSITTVHISPRSLKMTFKKREPLVENGRESFSSMFGCRHCSERFTQHSDLLDHTNKSHSRKLIKDDQTQVGDVPDETDVSTTSDDENLPLSRLKNERRLNSKSSPDPRHSKLFENSESTMSSGIKCGQCCEVFSGYIDLMEHIDRLHLRNLHPSSESDVDNVTNGLDTEEIADVVNNAPNDDDVIVIEESVKVKAAPRKRGRPLGKNKNRSNARKPLDVNRDSLEALTQIGFMSQVEGSDSNTVGSRIPASINGLTRGRRGRAPVLDERVIPSTSVTSLGTKPSVDDVALTCGECHRVFDSPIALLEHMGNFHIGDSSNDVVSPNKGLQKPLRRKSRSQAVHHTSAETSLNDSVNPPKVNFDATDIHVMSDDREVKPCYVSASQYSQHSESVKCGICLKSFIDDRQLFNHVKDHRKTIHAEATTSDEVSKKPASATTNESTPILPKCQKCGKIFLESKFLVLHMKECRQSLDILNRRKATTSNEVLDFRCEHCSERFFDRKILEDHIKRFHKFTQQTMLKQNRDEIQAVASEMQHDIKIEEPETVGPQASGRAYRRNPFFSTTLTDTVVGDTTDFCGYNLKPCFVLVEPLAASAAKPEAGVHVSTVPENVAEASGKNALTLKRKFPSQVSTDSEVETISMVGENLMKPLSIRVERMQLPDIVKQMSRNEESQNRISSSKSRHVPLQIQSEENNFSPTTSSAAPNSSKMRKKRNKTRSKPSSYVIVKCGTCTRKFFDCDSLLQHMETEHRN